MADEKLRKIFEDENLLVIDKPAGINSDDFEKRIHRLDKDTSGVLLIAKNDKALAFFQKQFKNKEVSKKYIALVVGDVKAGQGTIETLIGREKKRGIKQKVYLEHSPDSKGKRNAITEYKALKKFSGYTLMEAAPKTGRKHQIRCHFAYLGNPIAGDKLYNFKNQICPKNLSRQFLHATSIKIKMPNGETKEFFSELPQDLEEVIKFLISNL
jgi:23S rRNA pseudouridine1911/1915/1917 synthase